MPTVLVKNHGQAAHGFYESAVSPETGKHVTADEATFVKPGQAMVLHLPDAHMGENHIASSVQVMKNFTDDDVAALNATHSMHARAAITESTDDGTRSAQGANQRPDDAKAAGDGPGPVADEFDALDDDQLRAHITTRDGKAPHHMLGREKLLKLARGDDEAVG